MAEGKKSFVAYSDWNGMFKALPDEIAGKLIKHIFSYVNDENPNTEDFVINALFEQIKSTLKRDLKKWDKQRDQRSEAGKKSAQIRSTKSNERSTVVNEKERNSTVSVSVSVSDSNVLLKKEPKEGINFSGLLGCINSAFSKKLKVINATTQKKFNARLKDGYSKDDIFNAITNASHDEFHKESNFKWCTPEYFSRSTTLDKYGFESQPVKAEKLIVPHYNENYPANLGDGTPA